MIATFNHRDILMSPQAYHKLDAHFHSAASADIRKLVAKKGASAIHISETFQQNSLTPQFYHAHQGNLLTEMAGRYDTLKGEQIQIPEGTVMIVPIHGTIVQSCDIWEEMWYGLCSMDRIIGLVNMAAQNPNIVALGTLVNSPGGEVIATHNTIKALQMARKNKPVAHLIEAQATSGAQMIITEGQFSICNTSSALLGSIGVYTTHDDRSGRYEQYGIHRTYIAADGSTEKLYGADNAPLSEDALASIKSRLNDTRTWMIDQTIGGTKITDRNHEVFSAGVYRASIGVRHGLATRISRGDSKLELINGLRSAARNYEAPTSSQQSNTNSQNMAHKTVTFENVGIEGIEFNNADLTPKEAGKLQGESKYVLVEKSALESIVVGETITSEENAGAETEDHKANAEKLFNLNTDLLEQVDALKSEKGNLEGQLETASTKVTDLEASQKAATDKIAELEEAIKSYNPSHFAGTSGGDAPDAVTQGGSSKASKTNGGINSDSIADMEAKVKAARESK